MKRIHCFILPLFLSLIAAAQMNLQGNYDWEKNTKECSPSIRHAYLYLTTPRLMKIHAMRIDVKDDSLDFFVTPSDPDAGKPMPDHPKDRIYTKRQTTRDFLRQARKPKSEGGYGLDMLFAINANGFHPWTAPFNHIYACGMGLVISEGKLVCPSKGKHSFLVMNDGTVDIKYIEKNAVPENVKSAVTGFTLVISDDSVLPITGEALAPRTGIGISKDKRYVVIMTIDGRQKGVSDGAMTKEVGELLFYFGCSDGINLDGGGSTSLTYWDKTTDDAVLLTRQPGSNNPERPVGCNIGVYRKTKAAE